jgi:hypothetical protein
MESTAFFEKKISLTPKNINKVGRDATVESILLEKLREKLENKCSEHGFVIPDSLKILSRSCGYFEPGRFTGDAVYYVKAEGKVYYLHPEKPARWDHPAVQAVVQAEPGPEIIVVSGCEQLIVHV